MKPVGEFIKNFGWFILSCIVVWKITTIPISVDLSKFDFSDLTSLIVSFFSVWLSISFYHKANESSNQFYNNSYTFTKEISETLGKLEATFGERLKSLDQGYTSIYDKFLSGPDDGRLIKADNEIASKKTELSKSLEEKEQYINELLQKDQLTTIELAEARKDLNSRKEEIDKLNQQLQELDQSKQEILNTNPLAHNLTANEKSRAKLLLKYHFLGNSTMSIPASWDDTQLKQVIQDGKVISGQAILDMRSLNLLDNSNQLTALGMQLIREMVRIKVSQ